MASQVPSGSMGSGAKTMGLDGELQQAAIKSFFTKENLVKAMGSNVNTALGLGIFVYLVLAALQSLLFSFQYSVYTLLVAGLIVVGEVGYILPMAPFPAIAGLMTPPTKGLAYALSGMGGLACFVNLSWNPFLLAGHIGVCFLGYRYWMEASKAAAAAAEEQANKAEENI